MNGPHGWPAQAAAALRAFLTDEADLVAAHLTLDAYELED